VDTACPDICGEDGGGGGGSFYGVSPGLDFCNDPDPGIGCGEDAQAGQLAGGGGGEGVNYALVKYEIPGAISLALSVLNIPSCANALGYGVTAGGTDVTAADVLRAIAGGTAYGTIGADFIPPNPNPPPGPQTITNATTTYPISLDGYAGNAVQIKINDASGTSFNPTARTAIFGSVAITQTVTVLHELGHAMQLLFGGGLILPDENVTRTGVSQSGLNTAAIQTNCFPGVENRGAR
jgi:hypothetical protein